MLPPLSPTFSTTITVGSSVSRTGSLSVQANDDDANTLYFTGAGGINDAFGWLAHHHAAHTVGMDSPGTSTTSTCTSMGTYWRVEGHHATNETWMMAYFAPLD